MWTTFFAANASASATLAGLIFVGVSISLGRILSIPKLPDRALQSLGLLLAVLVISLLQLVPGQTPRVAGVEFLAMGSFLWPASINLDLGLVRNSQREYKSKFLLNMLLDQLSVLPYLIAGIVVLTRGPVGIYCIIPGLLFSFIKAIVDAWVLLVEIHR